MMIDLYATTFEQGNNYNVLAVQLSFENVEQVRDWCHGQQVEEKDPLDPSKTYVGLNVTTEKGNRRASEGDFVVQGPNDDFYVYSESTFLMLHTARD